MNEKKAVYKTVRITKEIADLIENIIKNSDLQFRSRADVVTTAIREYYNKLKKEDLLTKTV